MAKKQKSGLYRTKVKVGVDAEGKDINKWVSGKTKAELEQARKEVTVYYIDGTGLEEDRLFGAYAVEWFNVRKKPGLSASSVQSYRTALNKDILPVFGNRNLRAIRPTELQVFVNGFAGKSATKITMITATLDGVFKSACIDRILDKNPMTHVRKPAATPAVEKRALTEAERERIEHVCATHVNGAYLAAMYYLGVRPGEARGLQWGDFDFENDLVHIQRDIDFKAHGEAGALKTRASDRRIPVPAALKEILKPHRELPNVFLFRGRASGEALSKTTSERLWVELMAECGLVEANNSNARKYREGDIRNIFDPVITPHMLRHNYITMCWENGIDVYTTMRLVGHTSIKTTMDIYTHLSNAQMEQAKIDVGDMFDRKKSKEKKLHKSCTTEN